MLVNNTTYKDKVYVVEFFFTTCPSAVVGESEGKTDKRQRWRYIIASIQCSSVLGIVFCFIFAFGFDQILHLLTAQTNIISAAQAYYWIILALPLIAHWCYCLDGIYMAVAHAF